MTEIGIFLSSEENGPRQLVDFGRQAEAAGFAKVMISDHYHPWIERQGQSPFVWAVIGGLASTTSLEVTTGVTCPTMRIHPAVLAQAAATAALMLDGRFRFGVGSGEALNEHILGDRWPAPNERLEMLEEAVGVMRDLWEGGVVDHRGEHYRVVGARVYSLPENPPPVLISGFGPASTALAARIGDGYVGTSPEPDLVRQYSRDGGRGPKVGLMKVCWGPDTHKASRLAHEMWPTTGVPGQLNQELAMPAHFEQAAGNVTEDQVTSTITCGPDPEPYAEVIRRYTDAGYDELFVAQVGPDLQGFLNFYRAEIEPRL